MAIGVVISGLSAYAFLSLTAHILGATNDAPLAACWALAFLAGPGFFLPAEQVIGRHLAGGEAVSTEGAPIVRRVAAATGLLAIALVVAALAFSPVTLLPLFDHEWLVLAGFALVLPASWAMHLAWGILAGNGQFGAYGLVQGAEGVARLVGGALLAVIGVRTAGPYGVVLGIAPLVAVLSASRPLARAPRRGSDVSGRALRRELRRLILASILANVVMTAGPVIVKALAGTARQAEASRFLAGTVLARIPLFLFNAVSATLLPGLAGHVHGGRWAQFRSSLGRLSTAVALVGCASTIAAAAVGPWALRGVFGPSFALGSLDLAALGASTAGFMLATTFGQALIVLGQARTMTACWAAGATAMFAVVAVGHGLIGRVELSLVAGAATAAGTMAVFVVRAVRRREAHG